MRFRRFVVLAGCIACVGGDATPSGSHTRGAAPTELPRDPVALAAALGVPAESLSAAGEERYAAQSYDSALHILRVEAMRAAKEHDRRAEARARMWIGLAAWRLGDYGAARHEGEASLQLKQQLHLDSELSRSFNALGLLAWNQGRYSDALAHFDSAIASARRNHDSAGVARAAANVPLVKVELGDFEGARAGFESAYRLGVALHDDRMQGNALSNLAMVEIRLGQARAAVPLLASARSHYAQSAYAAGESNALGQLATAWTQLGDLQRAIAAADSALGIARAHGLQQEIASELEVLADLYLESGDSRMALRRLQEADSLDEALGLVSERGVNLRRVSSVLRAIGDTTGAIARAREALALHAKVRGAVEVAYDRLQLAQSFPAHQRADARAQLDSARSVAERVGSPTLTHDVMLVAARLAIDDGDPRRALDDLDAGGRNALPADWALADLRTEALLSAGRLEDARRSGERAMTMLERERGSLGVGPLRSRYFTSRVGPFARLIAIHLARHDTAAAFRVAASLSGRGIVEHLGDVAGASAGIVEAAEGERMLRHIAALEQELASVANGPEGTEQRQALQRAADGARASYEEFLSRHAHTLATTTSSSAAPDAKEIEAALREDEALLCFVSGPDHIDLFVVRSQGLLHRAIPIGARELASRVRVLREMLGGGRSPLAMNALGTLHEELLRAAIDAGALDGANRLLIVAHGALSKLPFAALRDERTSRFLVEGRTVRYVPSVMLMRRTRAAEPMTEGVIAFAPLADSLPGTMREVQAVARLVPHTRVRLGRASSEAEVRASLSHGSMVHIASHGLSNARNPMFSRMIVGRSIDNLDDGILAVHEVLGMKIRSPLIFLSGCETALDGGDGTVTEGADGSSLAAAFLMAGARTVVATLWRVDDEGAARFATSFYRHLTGATSAEEALADAQREEIHLAKSFTWASYTLSSTVGANLVPASVKQ